MKLQTASEHDIVIGNGKIFGVVNTSTNQKAWALPGGEVTLSREWAEWAARWISRRLG